MATQLVEGARTWSLTRDDKGEREYKVKYLVVGDPTDGPNTALNTSGLPQPGNTWNIDNDTDQWAFCRWNATVTPVLEKEPNRYFEIEFTFSTKQEDKACHQQEVKDPLLEPQKVSGSFTRYHEEITRDRFGFPVVNSAHEMLRGPHVEFDKSRATIKIEQNVAQLQLEIFTPMLNTVNALPMWGLAKRTIKLTGVSWDKKFYGNCYAYYTRTFDFEARIDGFDRNLLDESTKVLRGHWATKDEIIGTGSGSIVRWILDPVDDFGAQPDHHNPKHFIKAVGTDGNPVKILLNGKGVPAGVVSSVYGIILSIISNNTNIDIDDSSAWVPISSTEPEEFDEADFYEYGDLVITDIKNVAVCVADFTGEDPDVPGPDWVFLGNAGDSPFILNDKGEYNTTTTYSKGDYVVDATGTVGRIHVEAYGESNFFLLGIPSIL